MTVDHRYYLRSRPSIRTISTVEDIDYSVGMDGTYVTVQAAGTDAEGRTVNHAYMVGIYTVGARVCDAVGWFPDGMSTDRPLPSPLPGR